MTRILTLKYRCIKCNHMEYITVKNDSLDSKYQLVSKCFDNKICLDCYCASEKALHGTAEKIEDVLYG